MVSHTAHEYSHLPATAAGTFTMAEGLTVTRMGYGAMQLAGPHVFGPPADRAAAVAVLREAVALGITHIDTSDFYGPHVTNQIARPYTTTCATSDSTFLKSSTCASGDSPAPLLAR